MSLTVLRAAIPGTAFCTGRLYRPGGMLCPPQLRFAPWLQPGGRLLPFEPNPSAFATDYQTSFEAIVLTPAFATDYWTSFEAIVLTPAFATDYWTSFEAIVPALASAR